MDCRPHRPHPAIATAPSIGHTQALAGWAFVRWNLVRRRESCSTGRGRATKENGREREGGKRDEWERVSEWVSIVCEGVRYEVIWENRCLRFGLLHITAPNGVTAPRLPLPRTESNYGRRACRGLRFVSLLSYLSFSTGEDFFSLLFFLILSFWKSSIDKR